MSATWTTLFSTDYAREQFPPESVKTIRLGEQRICLARHNDTFYAVQDDCTHEGASLGKGDCMKNGMVKCPWHQYQFDLASGQPVGNDAAPLQTYPVREEDGELQLLIDAE